MHVQQPRMEDDDDDSSITYLQALELSTNFRRERRST